MLRLRDMLAEIRGGTPPPLWERPARPAVGARASADDASMSGRRRRCSAPVPGAPRSPRSSPTPGGDVTIWARRAAVAEAIRDRAPQPGLPARRCGCRDRVTATADAAEAIDGAELVVLAVPSQTLRGNLAEWAGAPATRTPRWSVLMKGIELGTTKRMSEVIVETAGVDPDRVVVVSGPNLAPEIAAEQPAATVVAVHRQPTAPTLVQTSIRDAVPPPVHQRRRDRLRAGRRGQERDRPRRTAWPPRWASATTPRPR